MKVIFVPHSTCLFYYSTGIPDPTIGWEIFDNIDEGKYWIASGYGSFDAEIFTGCPGGACDLLIYLNNFTVLYRVKVYNW